MYVYVYCGMYAKGHVSLCMHTNGHEPTCLVPTESTVCDHDPLIMIPIAAGGDDDERMTVLVGGRWKWVLLVTVVIWPRWRVGELVRGPVAPVVGDLCYNDSDYIIYHTKSFGDVLFTKKDGRLREGREDFSWCPNGADRNGRNRSPNNTDDGMS